MLLVGTNKESFGYDIHSLVKAFYGEETVKMVPLSGSLEELSICVEFKEEIKQILVYVAKELKNNIKTGEEDIPASFYMFEYGVEGIDDSNKKEFKNYFKAKFYECLCNATGKKLPWGNLTGIRPTKIAMSMLEENMEEEKIIAFMQSSHYVSEEKASLSVEIAKREKQILSSIHYKEGYSLYIGIPFCPTTCLYCSFTSYPICMFKDKVESYLDCLSQEMELVSANYNDRVLDTVYIGGGTPTTLEAGQLDRLICDVKKHFNMEAVKEFTVEAGRADSITEEKLRVLYKHGVTRISVNPQTMKQETLKLIGRQHTVGQVRDAFLLAREVGFDNINMDIILGLPGETKKDVQDTMKQIVKLAPDSLTIHSLAVKRASRLNQFVQENGISMLHNTDEIMKEAVKAAQLLEMKPYYLYRQKNMAGNFENVGYATDEKFGIYNILIMEEKQTIMALGAGSISKVVLENGRIERTDNVKDVKLYIEQIDEMLERKKRLMALS